MQPETHSFPVLANLKHNGKHFAKGDKIEMTAAQAKTLQALGVLGDPDEDQPALSAEERQELICEAIADLTPEADFNKDGSPSVKAVERITGFDVSADEVKAAHAALIATAENA